MFPNLHIPLVAYALCISLSALPLSSYAQTKKQLPKALFGVTLGGIYTFGKTDDSKDVGTFPITEIKGFEQFLGSGLNLYFKPAKQYEAFKYVEKRKKPSDKFFATSFRLYILPVFPKNVLDSKELRPDMLKWEVATVEWSEDEKTEDAAYFWVVEFCKTLRVDLEMKPEILDLFDGRSYDCKFKDANSEFLVWNIGKMKILRLWYGLQRTKGKDESVDAIRRKLRMNEIRPY